MYLLCRCHLTFCMQWTVLDSAYSLILFERLLSVELMDLVLLFTSKILLEVEWARFCFIKVDLVH